MTDQNVTITGHGPYEDLGIKALETFDNVVDGQPTDVRAELWRMFVEDIRSWREWWKNLKLPS